MGYFLSLFIKKENLLRTLGREMVGKNAGNGWKQGILFSTDGSSA
jgi:hypothetical protein